MAGGTKTLIMSLTEEANILGHFEILLAQTLFIAFAHGILNLRQCMQHFEFWLRVRCLVARFFDVVQIKIIVSMIR